MKRSFISLIALVALMGTLWLAFPASAQSGITWNAQFYNNPYLTGTPVATRQDTVIAFNWGAGAPASGVPADNFSARWSTSVNLSAGTYRFVILADDGVHLWIDNFNLVIDTFDTGAAGQTLVADVTLAAGTHNLQIDFREATGDAYLYFAFANLATNPNGPTLPGAPATPPSGVPVPAGNWTAQYYNNNALAGSPSAILSEVGPSHNWGTNAPLPNISADNFSARWTTSLQLSGQYRIDVQADDGVRVYVDNVLYINEWHDATAQTYSATVNLASGAHSIVVEYYERGGVAFLNFNLTPITGGTNNPPPTSGATAIVITGLLNVRNAPDPVGGDILTKIPRGTVVNVVGRLADSSWYQVQTNGITGWLSGRYVAVSNAHLIPIVTPNSVSNPTPNLPATGFALTARFNLNIRRGAGVNFGILGRLPAGQSAQILARNSSNTWWYVNYNGIIGWVSGSFVNLPPNLNAANVPVQ